MNNFKSSVQFAAYFVVAIWIVFLINYILPGIDLNIFGIHPRTIVGLRGIVFSPFLHGNLQHICSNSIPFFVLLFGVRYFHTKSSIESVILISLLGGLLTWIFARSAIHIGASGLIYGLASYLAFSGYYQKNVTALIVGLVTIFMYGGLVYGLLPSDPSISFEGHLFGAIAGFIVSKLQAVKRKSWKIR